MIFFLSCISPLAEPQEINRNVLDTQIESILLECNPDSNSEIWTLEVNTIGWSGGAFFWMSHQDIISDTSQDSNPISERHPFYSVGAQPDGSADRLKLTLTAVSDWRDAAPGNSTRWLCEDEEKLSFWVEILNASSNAIVDCEHWGVQGEGCL